MHVKKIVELNQRAEKCNSKLGFNNLVHSIDHQDYSAKFHVQHFTEKCNSKLVFNNLVHSIYQHNYSAKFYVQHFSVIILLNGY